MEEPSSSPDAEPKKEVEAATDRRGGIDILVTQLDKFIYRWVRLGALEYLVIFVLVGVIVIVILTLLGPTISNDSFNIILNI
ncbi:MAG: hypothetical protein ABI847_10215 [Anaerolineales bacterium]